MVVLDWGTILLACLCKYMKWASMGRISYSMHLQLRLAFLFSFSTVCNTSLLEYFEWPLLWLFECTKIVHVNN